MILKELLLLVAVKIRPYTWPILEVFASAVIIHSINPGNLENATYFIQGFIERSLSEPLQTNLDTCLRFFVGIYTMSKAAESYIRVRWP